MKLREKIRVFIKRNKQYLNAATIAELKRIFYLSLAAYLSLC